MESVDSSKPFGNAEHFLTFHKPDLERFVHKARSSNLKIAVVTSGGTTVPLEQRAVRFIDNFSTGTRGAACAEKFLELANVENSRGDPWPKKYAVVFLTREGSKQPYLRHAPAQHIAEASEIKESQVEVRNELIVTAFASWKAVGNRLFVIYFTTVQQYLADLYSIAQTVKPYRRSVLLFLAAAVSDYYVPFDELPEHKIQSDSEELILNLKRVPKCLGTLRHEWAPEAFVASFKVSYGLLSSVSPRTPEMKINFLTDSSVHADLI